MIINNGDIFDIGQTINGVSTFIYLNEKIYYFYDDEIQREYEYDIKEIYQNPFLIIKSVKNVDTGEDVTERFVSKDVDGVNSLWTLTKNLEWITQ